MRSKPKAACRLIGGAVAVLMLLMALPAVASAASYVGRVVGQPESSVRFDIRRDSTGERRVYDFQFHLVEVHCDNGPDGRVSTAYFGRPPRVNDNNRFRGSYEDGFQTQLITGQLKPLGKAEGTLQFSHEDVKFGTCGTGLLDWKAHRRPAPTG